MRWEGVRAIGVDEHVRRIAGHTFVTVIVDPAPVRERRDPSRARGTVPGSCEQALKTWLEGRPDSWKAGIEVVAMDGIGWAPSSAAAEELLGSTPREPPPRPPKPWTSADNAPAGRSGAARGRAGAPCTGCSAPSSLRPPCSHPTQAGPSEGGVFDHSAHTGVELTRSAYLRMLCAGRDTNPSRAAGALRALIRTLTEAGMPRELVESDRLGRTLKCRRADILAHYPPPPHPSGPTEATGGRLKHLRSTALGFRNQTRYRLRGPLETSGLAHYLHRKMRRTTKRQNRPVAHYPAAH